MITAVTPTYALVGHPVRHSLSPAMHNRLFAEHDFDAVYVALDVDPIRADTVGAAIRTLGLAGANLTVPFKASVLDELDSIDAAGSACNAVNVVVRDGELLRGHNTDAEGFMRGFEQDFGTDAVDGRSAVVLGAGGAARAVVVGLASRGIRRVSILNRTPANAARSRNRLTAHVEVDLDVGPLTPEAFADAAPDIIVNCTAGGARPLVEALDASALPDDAIWCDLNYWMHDPPHLEACRKRGLRTQDGLPMLVHQGVLSFRLFTGIDADASRVRTWFEDALE